MLNSDEVSEFLEDSAMLNTAESFTLFVSASPAFKRLKQLLKSGALTSAAIQRFVEGILTEFEVGRAFYGDKILGLVAQLVATGPEPFAGRFLRELGAIKCAELQLSPRVARQILRQRELWFSETSVAAYRFPDRAYVKGELQFSSITYPQPGSHQDPSVVISQPLNWAA